MARGGGHAVPAPIRQRVRDFVNWNGQAHAFNSDASGLAQHLGVDAYHTAQGIHQRAATVAGIQGRVCLEETVNPAGKEPTGYGRFQAENICQRITNGIGRFTQPDLVRVANGQRGQRRGIDHFKVCQVDLRVSVQDIGQVLVPIFQSDHNLLGVFHHMGISEDKSAAVHYEAGTSSG